MYRDLPSKRDERLREGIPQVLMQGFPSSKYFPYIFIYRSYNIDFLYYSTFPRLSSEMKCN